MTISPEQLKSLTTPQLRKLEKALLIFSQLEHDATCDFDKLLEQIRAPQSALSQTDAGLIGARTYELQIYKPHLDAERARAQAMREFKAGKLHKPKIPRGRPRSANHSCSPYRGRRQGKRGDRPRASRHACKLAYEACNRSATTPNRSTTGQRFSSPSLQQILSQRARRRLRLVKREDPHMLPNIPNYQRGADPADIRLTPANVRFRG